MNTLELSVTLMTGSTSLQLPARSAAGWVPHAPYGEDASQEYFEVKRPCMPPAPPDILQIARDRVAHAEPCAVFQVLLEAAMRAIKTAPESAKRNEVPNGALDGLYHELVGTQAEDMRVRALDRNELGARDAAEANALSICFLTE